MEASTKGKSCIHYDQKTDEEYTVCLQGDVLVVQEPTEGDPIEHRFRISLSQI